MQNRLTWTFGDAPASTEAAWQTDQQPTARIWWLFAGLSLPLLVVAWRLSQLQCQPPDRFTNAFEQTTVSYEPIPTYNGRVLGGDGRVLAEDRQQLTLHLHYRWLEEPADERWLRQQALTRLNRKQRRDPLAVHKSERDVLAERAAMWQRVSALTEIPLEELAQRRQQIQQRIERIVASVERRRQQAVDVDEPLTESTSDSMPNISTDVAWYRRAWEHLKREVTTAPPRRRQDPVIVQEELEHHAWLEGITLDAAAEIAARPQAYPGLKVETVSWRHYPAGRLAAHVVGVRTKLRGEELQERQQRLGDGDPQDYQTGDPIGRSGVERTYDRQLHGIRGLKKITRNRQGEILSESVVREPTPGRDVVLTLHLELQQRLQRILRDELAARTQAAHQTANAAAVPIATQAATGQQAAGAAIVVLDVRTGEVLASVSAPDFDVNDLQHPDPETWATLVNDPKRPFVDRVTQMAIPPGSVFKTVTAVAMLESGSFDPDEPLFCQGYLARPDQHRCYIYRHYGVGHGGVTLREALTQSCNVYFYKVARKLGPNAIADWAGRLGFGRPTGIDLPSERRGNLPRPPVQDGVANAAYSTDQSRWYPGDTLGLAIGQSRLTVTPLQVARMMATVANDGRLVTPRVVRRVGTTGMADDYSTQPPNVVYPLPELSPDTLAFVREGLERVVADSRGTGHKTVFMKEIAIAGKTGTAEVGGGKTDHAWFAGYAPADQPKVAFAVVLEHAGSGGRDAGPVARRVVETLLQTDILQPAR